jgi:hypothetical protein
MDLALTDPAMVPFIQNATHPTKLDLDEARFSFDVMLYNVINSIHHPLAQLSNNETLHNLTINSRRLNAIHSKLRRFV